MPIVYPIDPPASPGFRAATFRIVDRVAVHESPFTGETQAYVHPGSWWEVEAQLPPMLRATAAPWLAFLVALHGRAGTFRLGDPGGKVPRGSALGAPLVDGAGQVGETLLTKSWAPSTAGLLLPGDYVEVGGQLLLVVEPAASDAMGNAALTVRPGLRLPSADGGIITTTNPRGRFRLVDNSREWEETAAQVYGLTFAAREVP